MKRLLLIAVLIFAFTVFGNVYAQRQADEKSVVVKPTKVTQAIYHDVFGPLRDLPALTPEEIQVLEDSKPEKERNDELKERNYPFFDSEPKGPDPGWQKQMGQNSGSKVTLQNFAGQSSTSNPPDCNGTVGPDHYMQTINVYYTIYNKTGTLLAGPTAMNTLFSGVPGAGVNDGDPIIMYDEQADRWLAAEFSGVYSSPDYMLIAVSTTNDPTGTWNRWSFPMNGFPDYMKFGIWRDGYYMGTNTSSGDDIYVFERSVMIAGGVSPQVVQFDNLNRPNSGFHCVLPMDNDGAFAPSGTPGQFITINDGAWGGSDQLWIYNLNVNWITPASSTFSRVQTINVASFDANFGTNWDNIAQQGTSQELDAIPQVLMQRAQYRNWGTSQSLVCCHAVDVDNTDHAGIRWYELENTGSGWSIRQFGTYAPDAHSRWMGSIAMNDVHEIGLGYSVSSSSMYPAIRYCGQSTANNTLANGILDMSETSIQAGPASQTSSNRWGDYANVALDPNNDHDFWFTTEYAQTTSQKRTRIAAFQFSSPSTPPTADFSASNLYPIWSTNVIFTDLSTGTSPLSYQWTFTPGTVTYMSGSSTTANPIVRFNANGAYTVSLYVSNAYGNDTETKTGYIHVGQSGLWKGNTSTDWDTNTNWDNGEIPLSSTDVSIISTAPTYWPTKTGSLTVGTDCNSLNMGSAYTELTITGDLTISTGKTFYVDPTGIPNINVGGNWVKQGTFTEGLSTVKFYGTTNSNISLSKGSGKGIITTLDENFDGGSLPSGWSATNTNTSAWNVDASPNPPGYRSASYSLNYNNGTDYDDGAANLGIVTSAAIDNSFATSTTISFYYQLETEGAAAWDWAQIEVLRASDNAVLQTFGGDGTSITDVTTWTNYSITGNSLVIAESSIKLRFTFSADDGSFNNFFGWFIDDLHVEKNVPITSTSFFNLTSEKIGGGTVTTGVGVDVVNDFIIKPGSFFTNNSGNTLNLLGNAYFEANAGGIASFIDNGTSAFTNPPNVQLYLNDGSWPGAWHFLSSPIVGAQSNLFFGSYLYSFDEPNDSWINIYQTNVTLGIMKGYSAWTPFSSPATVTFSGSLNNGSYNIPVTRNTTQANQGWNLVGNPYPSSLDWDAAGWTKTNVNNTIYYYSGSGGTSNYKYYVGSGGETPAAGTNGGSNIIPPLQGFFVHASAAGTLGVTNTQRVHGNNTYYKNGGNEIELPLIRIIAEGIDLSDETIIRFYDGAISEFDGNYDAFKLFADDYPQVFSLTPSGTELAISTLPEINNELLVPVSFMAPIPGNYSLTFAELIGFDQQDDLYLEDLLMEEIQEVDENMVYAFEYSPLDDANRFLLHFGNPNGIVDGESLSALSIYSYGEIIYIQKPIGFDGQIGIYDMLGQELVSQNSAGEGVESIKVLNGTGYYLVKVQSGNKLVTEKVFIK